MRHPKGETRMLIWQHLEAVGQAVIHIKLE